MVIFCWISLAFTDWLTKNHKKLASNFFSCFWNLKRKYIYILYKMNKIDFLIPFPLIGWWKMTALTCGTKYIINEMDQDYDSPVHILCSLYKTEYSVECNLRLICDQLRFILTTSEIHNLIWFLFWN